MAKIYADSSGNQFVWDPSRSTMVPYSGSSGPGSPRVSIGQPAARSYEEMLKQNAKEMGTGEAMVLGTGREMMKLWRGAKELYGKAVGDDELVKRMERENVEEDKLFDPVQGEHPVATFTGAMAPYLATLPLSVATAPVRAIPAATRGARTLSAVKNLATAPVVKAAGAGAGVGAVHQDMTAAGGAAGALLGHGLGKAIARPLSRAKNILSDTQQEVVDWAYGKGFHLPPGMKTGRIGIQEIDQALRRNVKTSDVVHGYEVANQKLANQIAAEKIGIEGVDSLSPANLSYARSTIGKKLSDLAKETDALMTIDDQVSIYNDIWRFGQNKFNKKLADTMKSQLDDIFKKGTEDVAGLSGAKTFKGQDYVEINKILKDIIDQGYDHGNGRVSVDAARLASRIKNKFDDAVERGMKMKQTKTGTVQDWRDARAKYRFLNDIENSMSREGSSGDIDIKELYRNYMRTDRQRMLEGKMYDKDMEMLSKLGNLQSNQRGASLGASQMLGRMFKPGGEPGAGAMALLALGGKNALPFWDDAFTRLYLSGYPTVTGLMGLPSKTPGVMGHAGAATGIAAGINPFPWRDE